MSLYLLPTEESEHVTAIADIILPTNNQVVFFALPKIAQPVKTKGEVSKIIFLLPSKPPKYPPKGHRKIPAIQNEEANHDPKYWSI